MSDDGPGTPMNDGDRSARETLRRLGAQVLAVVVGVAVALVVQALLGYPADGFPAASVVGVVAAVIAVLLVQRRNSRR